MKALILDPHHSINALGGVRALGRAGWSLGVGFSDGPTLACRSRYVGATHPIPAAEAGSHAFLSAVALAVEEGDYDIVFPIEDADLLALSEGRSSVPAVVPLADHDVVLRALDKGDLTDVAAQVGLRSPRTAPASEEELRSWRGAVVLKSRLHWDPRSPGSMSRLDPRFFPSTDAPGMRHRLSYLRDHGAEPILQEHIMGRLMAISIVVDRAGDPLAVVQQETVGPWPSPHGISLRARTVAIDDGLFHRCVELLKLLNWYGLAELQFMKNRDGERYLIDLNGRFYGSMPLALAAGVNLAHLWGSMALGAPTQSSVQRGRTGIRYQWIQGDLVHSFKQSGLKRVRETLKALLFAFGATSPVISWRDPRPTLAWIWNFVSRKMGGAGS